MTIIKPTIGRKVWYWPAPGQTEMTQIDNDQALDATIIYVHSDTDVNLQIVDHKGAVWTKRAKLNQGEDANGEVDGYATWMPYQVGQAAKAAA